MRGTRSFDRRLLQRGRWPHYLVGMLIESVYILALTVFALLAAIIATVVF